MKDKFNNSYWLMHGDCLEKLKQLKDESIDAIICDPPFGGSFTNTSWDKTLNWDLLWPELIRIIKTNGAIVLFCSQPFTSQLLLSNKEMYRYQWFWEKSKVGGFQHAKLRPLKVIEDILVFSKSYSSNGAKNLINYYPQGLVKINAKKINNARKNDKQRSSVFHVFEDRNYVQEFTGYPKNLLKFQSASKTVHATQKPIELMEYLVKTYTRKNEIVLDFTYGSCSTGIACINSGRQFIGIEKTDHYYKVGYKRIKEAYKLKKRK